MFIKNKYIENLESLFFLSPLAILLMAIFNFPDTKFILSRLIPVVCLYGMIKYGKEIKDNYNFTIEKLSDFWLWGCRCVFYLSRYSRRWIQFGENINYKSGLFDFCTLEKYQSKSDVLYHYNCCHCLRFKCIL